jgi:hypothetical protein
LENDLAFNTTWPTKWVEFHPTLKGGWLGEVPYIIDNATQEPFERPSTLAQSLVLEYPAYLFRLRRFNAVLIEHIRQE